MDLGAHAQRSPLRSWVVVPGIEIRHPIGHRVGGNAVGNQLVRPSVGQ